MSLGRHITLGMVALSFFAGCVSLPKQQPLADGRISKTRSNGSHPPRFSKAEFQELLAKLKPLLVEGGFECYDDGERGGFSIVEGPIHRASYGLGEVGPGTTWLRCSIKATKRALQLEIVEYEDTRRSGVFTTTKIETDTVEKVIKRIRQLLTTDYPDVKFDVKMHEGRKNMIQVFQTRDGYCAAE